MIEINLKGLDGEQVHRDGIARKGIEHEHIELLRRRMIEAQPCVAMHNLGLSLAVGEVVEVFTSEPLVHRIDFVKLVVIAGAGIGGQRADSQTD